MWCVGDHKETYLLALSIDVDPERRIFLLEAVERTGKVGSFSADRLDSQGNDRVRYEHRGLRLVRDQKYVAEFDSPHTIE